MKYLLDTDVLINHLRKKKALSEVFFQKGCGISVVTKGELLYGAYKSSQPRKNLRIVESLLEELPLEILPLEDRVLHLFGELKAKLEKKGKRLSDFDLLIAATALSRNLILVTGNIRHYQRIPNLRVIS